MSVVVAALDCMFVVVAATLHVANKALYMVDFSPSAENVFLDFTGRF